MSNLSQQFSGGPNPFLVGIAGIDKGLSILERRQKMKHRAMYLNSRQFKDSSHIQNHIEKSVKDVTTTKPVTLSEEPQMELPTATPAKPSDMAIHPITGENVPRVPIKRSNYKKTPPGTKPKKK